MLTFSRTTRVFLAVEPTDMRKPNFDSNLRNSSI